MKMLYLVVFCSLLLVCLAGKPLNLPRASVPVPFRRGRSLNGLLFPGTMRKIIREMKTSFCSELESVALQLTRPSSAAISLSLIDDLVNFINIEFEDQSLMDNLLVKLSRKFAEPNIYTMIKTLLVLHIIMEKSSQNGRETLGNLFLSLRTEIDEKLEKVYFDVDNIEVVAKQASTVQELQAVEFARIYSSYVFEYIEIKSDHTLLTTKLEYKARMSELHALKELGENVLKSADIVNETATAAVFQQCCSAITNDQKWIIDEMNRVKTLTNAHESNALAAAKESASLPPVLKANATTTTTNNTKKKKNITVPSQLTQSASTISASIPKKESSPKQGNKQNTAKRITKTDSISIISAVNKDNIENKE